MSGKMMDVDRYETDKEAGPWGPQTRLLIIIGTSPFWLKRESENSPPTAVESSGVKSSVMYKQ